MVSTVPQPAPVLNSTRSQIEKILSSLGNRVFLMNNTHEDKPEIFQTRWALSYLRGPLTRDQIKTLMDPLKASGSTGTAGSTAPNYASVTSAQPVSGSTNTTQQASLPPDIPSFYIPVRGSASSGNKLLYMPKMLGAAKINFSDPKTKIELTESKVYVTPVTDNAIPVIWDSCREIDIPATDLEKSPQMNALVWRNPLRGHPE